MWFLCSILPCPGMTDVNMFTFEADDEFHYGQRWCSYLRNFRWQLARFEEDRRLLYRADGRDLYKMRSSVERTNLPVHRR